MNHELEKLLDLTLVDGYISDKEREVLKRKAQKLGLAEGEADIYIDAKLHEINLKNGTAKQEIKCPACGQVVTADDIFCPSCDYNLEQTTTYTSVNDEISSKEEIYKDYIKNEIENYTKAVSKPTFGYPRRIIKTIFTGGLYIVYKLTKREFIFDAFPKEGEALIAKTDIYKAFLDYDYPEHYCNWLIEDRNKAIKKRRKKSYKNVITWFLILIIIPFGWYKLMQWGSKKDTLNEKTVHKTEEIVSVKASSKKLTIEETVDSLTKAGNFSAALEIAELMDNNEYDDYLKRRIDVLVAEKKYGEAKKLAGKIKLFNLTELRKIELAIALDSEKE